MEIIKPVQDNEERLSLESPCFAVRFMDNKAGFDHNDQVPVAVLTNWDNDHVFGEKLHVFCPSFHPHVSLLCRAQIGILLKTVWFQSFARWLGEHALVEHCGENINVGSVLLVQFVLMEVG